MVTSRTKASVAYWHKWMGLILSVPLLGWVISSAVLMVITYDLPNGLAGVYRLQPFNSVDVQLTSAKLSPTEILQKVSSDYGLERVHWIRLESRGSHLLYIVRPTPFSLSMTFDANTGRRLDPLSDDLLTITANESLVGTKFQSLEDSPDFNRDYSVERVPAVAVKMVGEQPTILILSRDAGRTLRRANDDTERFHWWYKIFHVNQFTDHVIPWTALLYICVLGVLVSIVLGYFIFWWRRNRVVQVANTKPSLFSARNLHRKIGVAVGGVLFIQLAIGIYIWLSLGPLNDAFRGKPSFANHWKAGITSTQTLADASTIFAQVADSLPISPKPIQAIEWRKIINQDVWLITSRKDERPIAFSATTGEKIEAIHPNIAGEVARQEMIGNPNFKYLEPLHFASMDLAQKLPAYRFRFDDAQNTDVYMMQNTGEIVMRRPFFWRLFGPFLNTHTLAFTKNKSIDITLLALFQICFLMVIITGWRLQFPAKKSKLKINA